MMSAAAIISAATGLLSALTEIARLAGENDAAEQLEQALAALRSRRAEVDAVHVETDARLEAPREQEALGPIERPDVYEEES